MCIRDRYTLLLRPISQVESVYTATSRKVVGKNVHATIPKGNMGYGQYTVPDQLSCRTYFCCFPLTLGNLSPWPLVAFLAFLQISLKNSELKTTHNTFDDCRVHFFRQLFSKWLYIRFIHVCPRRIKALLFISPLKAPLRSPLLISGSLWYFSKIQLVVYYQCCVLIG